MAIEEFRFECTKCGFCCTDKKTIVNVTYLDILRIKNGLDLTLNEVIEILGFYVFDKKLAREELKKMVLSPIETEKGLTFIGLMKKASGECYFFNEQTKKCSIYTVRHMFCRTFPFTFRIVFDKQDKTKAKIIMFYTEKGKNYCPGIGLEAPIIDEKEWIKIGKTVIEEMNDNHFIAENWNEAVRKSKITPSVRNFLLGVFKLKEKSN